MTPRERFHAVMGFKPFDRLPVMEWAPFWGQTIDRWHTEGLPDGLPAIFSAIHDFFGLEWYPSDWFGGRGPNCPSAKSHGAGIIADMDDYERILPHLYHPQDQDNDIIKMLVRRQAAGEVVLWYTLSGFFWFARGLLGIEGHLFAFHDQPELLHRINSDLADYHRKVIETVSDYYTPDYVVFAEDMSYNHGSMVSQSNFEEFMTPYYQRVVPLLKERGILVMVDSDGDITEPAKWFDAAGIDGLFPLERQSGVDIDALRERYPRMRFLGHFDKMVLHKGEAAIRAEFERLMPVASRGGFIISMDHQTPPQASYDDYKLYVKLFREYAEVAGRASQGLL